MALKNFRFKSQRIEFRGPAPFVFVPIPPDISAEIKAVSSLVTYGWSVIPVKAKIGQTEYSTSLFSKNGIYLVPSETRCGTKPEILRRSQGFIEFWPERGRLHKSDKILTDFYALYLCTSSYLPHKFRFGR